MIDLLFLAAFIVSRGCTGTGKYVIPFDSSIFSGAPVTDAKEEGEEKRGDGRFGVGYCYLTLHPEVAALYDIYCI